MSADGRFAPSPSGPLHLGSLRTALIAWLFARAEAARFLVRIEDLDPQRSRREFEEAALADLEAIGLDWDETPVRQSERGALYDEALRRLVDQGRAYPCFCTRAEIREASSAPHGVAPEGFYPGTCRRISEASARARVEAGERHALRLRAEAEEITFTDGLLGVQSGVVDDFVIRRSDGVHAYQLAVVVDDAEQRIGEVVRGADLVESTPRQILLARLLELESPRYVHVPLVLAPDGTRLAKRHRSSTLADRREPAARTLALLAHSLGLALDRTRVETAAELLREFSRDRIPREPFVIG